MAEVLYIDVTLIDVYQTKVFVFAFGGLFVSPPLSTHPSLVQTVYDTLSFTALKSSSISK